MVFWGSKQDDLKLKSVLMNKIEKSLKRKGFLVIAIKITPYIGPFIEAWESEHVPFSSTISNFEKTRFYFSRCSMAVYNPECSMDIWKQ